MILQNERITRFDESTCYKFGRGDYEEYDEKQEIISVFDGAGKIKKEVFGTVKVKIIEEHKGYKPNTVFYGIYEDGGYERVVIYGLSDRKKKDIQIGELKDISPLEIVISGEFNKNILLLENTEKQRNNSRRTYSFS